MKRIIKVLGIFLLIIFVIEIFIKKRIIDETLAVYVNDELQSSIPKKGEALFKKAICDNDVKVSWDNDTWSLKVSNLKIKTKCNLYFDEGQTVFNFDYTGNEQTFTAPFSGTYKLETWGGQGGDANNYSGGSGGYSYGTIHLNKNDVLYINIGGAGSESNVSRTGGYNGGGTSTKNGGQTGSKQGSGGGAAHIAIKSGLLSSLKSNKDSILIVAGGGGGANYWPGGWQNLSYQYGLGGAGGGYQGVNGTSYCDGFSDPSCHIFGHGGTQIAGGSSGGSSSSFGQGGNAATINAGGAGGGGGYYGGGGSSDNAGGGGGSGYIGNSLLTDKAMYCYNCAESSEENAKTISTTCNEETPTENCAKKGNGYAKITLVNIEE